MDTPTASNASASPIATAPDSVGTVNAVPLTPNTANANVVCNSHSGNGGGALVQVVTCTS